MREKLSGGWGDNILLESFYCFSDVWWPPHLQYFQGSFPLKKLNTKRFPKPSARNRFLKHNKMAYWIIDYRSSQVAPETLAPTALSFSNIGASSAQHVTGRHRCLRASEMHGVLETGSHKRWDCGRGRAGSTLGKRQPGVEWPLFDLSFPSPFPMHFLTLVSVLQI